MYQRFCAIADRYETRTGLTNETERMTFGEIRRLSDRIRPLLCVTSAPVKVLLALPGGPSFTAVQLACFAEKAVCAPVSNQSKGHEVEDYLHLFRPDLLVVESLADAGEFLEKLQPEVPVLVRSGSVEGGAQRRVLGFGDLGDGPVAPLDVRPADLPLGTILILFTSGSTGRPKGILLSEDNLRSYLENNCDFLESFAGRDVFCPMPQFHAFCGTVVLEHLLYGGSVHLANTFMPGGDIQRMAEFDCTAILAAPTYLRLLQQMGMLTRDYVPGLSSVSVGTAAIDAPLVGHLQEAFPQLHIHLRYGLTETMGPITRLSLGPGMGLEAAGLVGAPVPGVEIAAGLPSTEEADPGEVRVRSGVVAVGQLLARDDWHSLLDQDGYFPTGDLGCLDGKGRLHLRGRISSFIKRNGFRINPFEIESLLRIVSGVRDVAVLGVPDAVSGQKIVICLETGGDPAAPDEQAVRRICRDNLSIHKQPQAVRFFTALPRTGSGKPDRPRLAREQSDV